MKSLMVIGSNSFTGSHFVQYALRAGYSVTGVSRSQESQTIFLPYRYKKTLKHFSFYQMDVNRDTEELVKLADKHEPEIIANFAAQGEVRNSWKYPAQWYQTNCLSIVYLTEELRKRDYIKKYVTSSTPEVYGSTEQNLKENHQYYPSTPYAASKLAGDLHLNTLHKRYHFPVVFTRAANVYGIHQQLFRIIPRTIIYLKMGRLLELHGAGRAIRSFIHIRDVVNATMLAAEKGTPGDVYHVAPNGDGISIEDLVRQICKRLDHDFGESVKLVEENYGQDSMYSLNSDKIRSELAWSPEVAFEKGLEETIEWIEENWELIRKMPLEYIHKP